VERQKSHGTEVVLIFGPMPKASLNAMARYGEDYAYIEDLRRYVASNAPVPVFDFHNGQAFGSPDCEFRDGFHGGEVTYMRMLLDAASRPDSLLSRYVDLPFLKKMVAENNGRLTIGSPFIRQAMSAYLAKEAGREACRPA
jgi:hypothetical protein